MLRQENSYKLYTDEGNVPYWNTEAIAAEMPFLYSAGRNKTNGKRTIKARNFPGYLKQRGSAIYAEAYKNQDKVRRDYREAELKGEMPILTLITPFGNVRLNVDLMEYFINTSEIAELYVRGWRFTAE